MQLYLLGFTAAAELKNATGINVWMILAGKGKNSERRSNLFMLERVDRHNKCMIQCSNSYFWRTFLGEEICSFKIFSHTTVVKK